MTPNPNAMGKRDLNAEIDVLVDMFPGVGGRPKFSRDQLQELLEESESFDKVFETLLEFVDLNENMEIEEIDLTQVESEFREDNIF